MSGYSLVVFATLSFIITICFTLSYKSRRSTLRNGKSFKNLFSVIGIFASFFLGAYFIGLRPFNAGFDTPKYVLTFNALSDISTSWGVGQNYFGNSEFLFWPLQATLKLVAPSASDWIFATYIFTFFCLILSHQRLSRETSTPLMLVVFIFYTYDLVYLGNILRQAMSFPLGILACYYLAEKKYIKWSALLAIAIGLHWSSLIFLVTPFFQSKIFNSRSNVTIYLIACAMASPLMTSLVTLLDVIPGLSIFTTKANTYMTHDAHFGSIYKTMNFLACIALGVAYVAFFDQFKNYKVFNSCFLVFLGVIIGGTAIPDLSERYIPNLLFFMPVVVYLIFNKLMPKAPQLRNITTALLFIAMGALVLNQESTIITLGIH